jgi:hypothetical protein
MWCFIAIGILAAQDSSWLTMSIPGVCSLKIPPTLEIQSGTYKELGEKLQNLIIPESDTSNRVIAQPKGINQFDLNSLESYSRVILNFHKGKPGDYLSKGTPVDITNEELKEIDKLYKNEFINEIKTQNNSSYKISLVEWFPIRIVSIQDYPVILISYIRTANDNSSVLVRMYNIHNDDKFITLDLSYRISESEIWKNDFDRIINTIKIY